LIFGGPASTSGSSLLFLALNILEGLGLKALACRATEAVHWVVEAVKLAWKEHRKTAAYVAESAHSFELMATKSLASRLRPRIDPDHAPVQEPSYRTPLDLYPDVSSHIAAVDSIGNMAILSQTQGVGLFGSGLTIPALGLVMNNGMVFFDPRRGRPHSLEPGKIARLLMGSIMVLRKGRPFIALAATGGVSAIAPLAHMLIDIIEHGHGLPQAFASPRLIYEERGTVIVEKTLPPKVRKGLQKMGHVIELAGRGQKLPGPALGIQVDPEGGGLTGYVDMRRDGGALAGY
jgi:gamma-glutamyltranspeptidase/glutathione hydrolase